MTYTLVLTVGTGRNRKDIAQAILFSVNKHNTNKVIFLCSKMTAKQTLPIILEQMGKTNYKEYIFDNENNVQFLYQSYLDIIKKHKNVIVDFTSGTKAMSAALFAAGIAAGVKQVSYVIGDRDNTGRVVKSTGLLSFPPDLVLAERQLERARALFNGLDFHAAWVLADIYRKSLPKDNPLRNWAKTIYLVGRAYDCWDHFKWKESASLLYKAANPREGLIDIDNKALQANASFVGSVAKNEYGLERLIDLMSNTTRRIEQGRYDDALARMYRAYEYLIQVRFKNFFDIETNNVELEKLAKYKLTKRTKDNLTPEKPGRRISIGLRDSLGLLAELKDQVGLKLINLYWKSGTWHPGRFIKSENAGPLQCWLNERNRSFMAHGTKPAKSTTVESLLKEYQNILGDSYHEYDAFYNKAKMIKL